MEVSIQGKPHIPCVSLRHVSSHQHGQAAGVAARVRGSAAAAAAAPCLTKIRFLFSVIFGRQSNLLLACAFVTRCLSTLIVLVFANQINRMAFSRQRRFPSIFFFLVFIIFLFIIAQRLVREGKLHRRLNMLECSFPLYGITRYIEQGRRWKILDGDTFSAIHLGSGSPLFTERRCMRGGAPARV